MRGGNRPIEEKKGENPTLRKTTAVKEDHFYRKRGRRQILRNWGTSETKERERVLKRPPTLLRGV